MRDAGKLVEQANQRLRSGKFGVTQCLHGVDDWLSVRGTFPPRPGDQRTKPYQTRIALKIRAEPPRSAMQKLVRCESRC